MSMNKPPAKDDDPFLRVALPFILGVVMGFTLVLMGFILLALAGLSAIAESNNTPAWVWLIAGIISEVVGVFLMKKSLEDSPTPGTIDPRKVGKDTGAETKSKEEVEEGVGTVFGSEKKSTEEPTEG